MSDVSGSPTVVDVVEVDEVDVVDEVEVVGADVVVGSPPPPLQAARSKASVTNLATVVRITEILRSG